MCQSAVAHGRSGEVYVLTNQPTGNSVLVFHRDAAGILTFTGSFASGGNGGGTGADPLASEGALILSGDHRLLFAVNAGSNSVSVFAVRRDALTLLQTVSSSGTFPVSVTVRDNLLYVVNAGGTPNISGFTIEPFRNRLVPLTGSTQNLPGGASASPAEISFNRHGSVLLVTEKGTNRIDTFTLNDDGVAQPGVSFPSSGIEPFGFSFGRDDIAVVSDAGGTGPGTSAVTSYSVDDDGKVSVVTPALSYAQSAACWLVLPRNGKFAYAANAGSGTIATFTISEDGVLELLDPSAAAIGSSSTPTDMAFSENGRFLYVRDGGDGTISGFHVEADGSLTPVTTATGLPSGAAGLAAR
jgi:6-phosphogluconolactonase (cycloisomerase 2 family)